MLTVPGEAGMGGRGWGRGVSQKRCFTKAVWQMGKRTAVTPKGKHSSRLTGKTFKCLFSYFLSKFIVLEKENTTFPSISSPKWFLKQNQLLKENNLFYLYQQKKKKSYVRHTLWSRWEIQHSLSTPLSRHSSGTQLLEYPISLLQLGKTCAWVLDNGREGGDICSFRFWPIKTSHIESFMLLQVLQSGHWHHRWLSFLQPGSFNDHVEQSPLIQKQTALFNTSEK